MFVINFSEDAFKTHETYEEACKAAMALSEAHEGRPVTVFIMEPMVRVGEKKEEN